MNEGVRFILLAVFLIVTLVSMWYWISHLEPYDVNLTVDF